MKQKVQTVIILGMIFLSASTFGQTPSHVVKKEKTAKTYLDLMVNIVSSNLNYGDVNKEVSDYKKCEHGIQAGLSFQAGITPGFSLVTELYYMKKGGTLKGNNPLFENEYTLHVNTIEMPVMARFHFGRVYLNAGPYVAYNVSGNQKTKKLSSKLMFSKSSGSFERFEAGFQAGGGYEFPWKKRRIALDLRYSYGLTSIASNTDIYNRVIMISVHVSKPWKRNPLGRVKN